ncbi:guanylate kinase-like protein [Variola virus]|uniref:Guanylate kinase-like protein n=1 Tax=Variola virus TaxID=10255 RepID=Q0N8E3_VARV|nr:guanylate kinase-like protein [Variola virus]
MEREGVDYHYVNREAIWKGIATGNFLEHTEFLGNIYGTSKTAVNTAAINNRICVMDLNIDGVRSLKNTYLMPYSVYINLPLLKWLRPSFVVETLKRTIRFIVARCWQKRIWMRPTKQVYSTLLLLKIM